jgi:hypothetical protein
MQTQTTTTFFSTNSPTGFALVLEAWRARLNQYTTTYKYVDDESRENDQKKKWAQSMVALLEACVDGNQNAIELFDELVQKNAEFKRVQNETEKRIAILKQNLNASGVEYARVQSRVLNSTW